MDLSDIIGRPGVMPTDPGKDRVLVVDDDLRLRMLMVRLLRKKGYVCQPASSTREAREHLGASDFGVVVTDMRMFAEDGIELVRHVADNHPSTFSIVVTGLDLDELEGPLRRAGAFSILAKPLDHERFGAAVDAAMERRDATVALRRHQS